MKKIEWNKVTWYSKLLAVIIFLLLIIWIFYLKHEFNKANAYLAEQSQVLEHQSSTQSQYSPIAYSMLTATTTNATYEFPVITSFPNREVMDKVNQQLADVQKNLSCTPDTDAAYTIDDLRSELRRFNPYNQTHYSEAQIQAMNQEALLKALDWEFGVQAKVVNTSKNIFSVSIGIDFNCGGAHPGTDDVSITFDMNTGNKIEFKDLFRYKNVFGDTADAQKDPLALAIFPDVAASTTLQDTNECDPALTNSTARDSFQYSSFNIEHEKLFIIPSLPHAMAVCGEAVEVPVSKIAQYIDTNSILARLK